MLLKLNHEGSVATAETVMQRCWNILSCEFGDFTEKSVVCVWLLLVFVLPPVVPAIHTSSTWGRKVSTLWSHSCLTFASQPVLPPSLLLYCWRTQSDPRAQVLVMDHAATLSHDGALLCRPWPRSSWEIEWIHVKVKAWRLEGKKRKILSCLNKGCTNNYII